MAEPLQKRVWARRLGIIAATLSIGAVLAALVASLGSGGGLWGFRAGFQVLQWALVAAGLGVLIGVIALAVAPRAGSGRMRRGPLIGILVGGAFLLYLGSYIATARSVPAIHDVATNLDDVPKFYRLRVRDDNMESIPDMGRRDLAAMPPRERWKAVHREAYGDLATIRVPWTVPETVARAEALAREKGWDVVTADPRMGIVEAVDTSSFFKFKDNVLVRARPAPGGGTAVDMRSISRVGASDIGVNARRVRDFLRDLAA